MRCSKGVIMLRACLVLMLSVTLVRTIFGLPMHRAEPSFTDMVALDVPQLTAAPPAPSPRITPATHEYLDQNSWRAFSTGKKRVLLAGASVSAHENEHKKTKSEERRQNDVTFPQLSAAKYPTYFQHENPLHELQTIVGSGERVEPVARWPSRQGSTTPRSRGAEGSPQQRIHPLQLLDPHNSPQNSLNYARSLVSSSARRPGVSSPLPICNTFIPANPEELRNQAAVFWQMFMACHYQQVYYQSHAHPWNAYPSPTTSPLPMMLAQQSPPTMTPSNDSPNTHRHPEINPGLGTAYIRTPTYADQTPVSRSRILYPLASTIPPTSQNTDSAAAKSKTSPSNIYDVPDAPFPQHTELMPFDQLVDFFAETRPTRQSSSSAKSHPDSIQSERDSSPDAIPDHMGPDSWPKLDTWPGRNIGNKDTVKRPFVDSGRKTPSSSYLSGTKQRHFVPEKGGAIGSMAQGSAAE